MKKLILLCVLVSGGIYASEKSKYMPSPNWTDDMEDELMAIRVPLLTPLVALSAKDANEWRAVARTMDNKKMADFWTRMAKKYGVKMEETPA